MEGRKLAAVRSFQLPRISQSKIRGRKERPLSPSPQGFRVWDSIVVESDGEDRMTRSNSFEIDSKDDNPITLRFSRHEQAFDEFANEAFEGSLAAAVENIFTCQTSSVSVMYCEFVDSLKIFYAPSRKITFTATKGILADITEDSSMIKLNNVRDHPSFNEETDVHITSERFVLILPLVDHSRALHAIVILSSDTEISNEDVAFSDYFARKFNVMIRYLLHSHVPDNFLIELIQIQRLETGSKALISKFKEFFNCRSCEFWSLDGKSGSVKRYTEASINDIDSSASSIALEAMSTLKVQNCLVSSAHANYNAAIDGEPCAMIVVPITESTSKFTFAICLRDPICSPIFVRSDEEKLNKIIPYVAMCMANMELYSYNDDEFVQIEQERNGLLALIEVAEVLGEQLETDKLTELIMERARVMTKSDRCSLFLYDREKNRLATSFHRGLSERIILTNMQGIAGRTAIEGKVFNIPDVYEDPRFDPTTDLKTGYKTKSLLSVPIFDNNGDVIAVTQMVNKENDGVFSEWDSRLMQDFNVFCGISLENARLYNESRELNQRLKAFCNISVSVATEGDIKRVMTEILSDAKASTQASCATLFLIDEAAETYNPYITDGGKSGVNIPFGQGLIGACVDTKKAVISNKPYEDKRFVIDADCDTNFVIESILVQPIIDKEGHVLGVIELVNKPGGFSERDIDIVNTFTSMASISLDHSKWKGIALMGGVEIEMSKLMSHSERNSYQIPEKLKLTPEEIEEVRSINFFCVDWQGIKQIKELFYLFSDFGLLEEFKITNELFFRFINEVRSTYNDVPYHNWTHACDVTQYVCFEIRTAKMDSVFTKLELYSLLLAAVCHDSNHRGLNNGYNVKAETPLGILFKDQSVMETHHCSMAINIMSQEQFNMLHALSLADERKVWSHVIKLILSTDMAFHFNFLKEMNQMVDEGPLNMEDPDNRMRGMRLLLKEADISNVSRPFPIADKWCDILCEEFYRQGDSEKALGLGLSSPLNDREHPEKAKSQVGFYNFICIPLYQLTARIFPELQVGVDSVKSNLAVWISQLDDGNAK